jgi:addiction module HigA family antidote
LQQIGSSREEFACAIRVSLVSLNQTIEGRRGMTADMALRLAKATGIGAETWLALQQQWDLHHTEDVIRDELAEIRMLSAAPKRLAA